MNELKCGTLLFSTKRTFLYCVTSYINESVLPGLMFVVVKSQGYVRMIGLEDLRVYHVSTFGAKLDFRELLG